MISDKYNMTQDENVFLAKRNMVDSMWKSANLEGIAVTFPETQAIFEGLNVAHLRIDEIQTINNLKHTWQFILSTINNEINFDYISSVNSLVGSNIVDSAGKLRKFDVTMGGTNWKPELPKMEALEKVLNEYQKAEDNITDRIITLMCKLMKMQCFNDGNKRTAMLVANHELIKNGKGIIAVSKENKIEFGEKLINYYENGDEIEKLKQFIFEKCLDGIIKEEK